MAVDAATVRKVARLARIAEPEHRLEPLAKEISGILQWIEQLGEVDVTGVEPMTSCVAVGLIIGLPVNMDGTEGTRCQSNRAFARNLLRLKDLPIAFWDERLSTSAVERVLIGEADLTRARRAEVVDKTAAAWILQGALDRMRGMAAG